MALKLIKESGGKPRDGGKTLKRISGCTPVGKARDISLSIGGQTQCRNTGTHICYDWCSTRKRAPASCAAQPGPRVSGWTWAT